MMSPALHWPPLLRRGTSPEKGEGVLFATPCEAFGLRTAPSPEDQVMRDLEGHQQASGGFMVKMGNSQS
jgi:hypothetical protein